MISLIKHKRVEFTELFYDLVFVYAISRTTALIHHLHHGVVSWDAFFTFLTTVFVLVNTWMIQTVFTNRYGKNSFFNIVVMFANVAMMLLIANMISTDWQSYFYYFCWTMGFLSLTLFLQYLVEYLKKEDVKEERPRLLLMVTAFRTLVSFAATLFPVAIGNAVFLGGILLTLVVPIFFQRLWKERPIIFSHLVERVSLLVIITFGEMIIGVADFFKPETFGLYSIFFFIIMAQLFLYYFGQFDHALDEEKLTSGVRLIYSHYPIFIGLMMITVSMSFLREAEAHHLFVTAFLYAGLLLFQAGVLANSPQNKAYLRYSKGQIAAQFLITLLGFGLSLIFAANSDLVIYITTATVFALETYFSIFYTRRSQAHDGSLWDWF